MDNAGRILVIKFVMIFVFAFVALGFFRGNAFNWITLVALAVTAITYLLGDILILPTFSNVVASVADGLIAMLVAHVAGVVIFGFRTGAFPLILFGALVATGEYALHARLLRKKEAR